MKIGIIGAGFGGLTTGYELIKKGHEVIIFDFLDHPGGLAYGFKETGWQWPLEKHYHHLFKSDKYALRLAKEVGQKIVFTKTKTGVYLNNHNWQLDTPLSLFRFNEISFFDRLRSGLLILFLKLYPFWRSLEKISVARYLKDHMGLKAYQKLWQPLILKKFGKYAGTISTAWFWTRIQKRGNVLGYPTGGFTAFLNKIVTLIESKRGVILLKTKVTKIINKEGSLIVTTDKGRYEFDKVIYTGASQLLLKLYDHFPLEYKNKVNLIKSIGTIEMILSLKEPYFKDKTYWLSINESKFPFLALVEHTNYQNKKYYDNECLLYIGNYLDHNHSFYKKTEKELTDIYLPYLVKINPHFRRSLIKKTYLYKDYYSQPITSTSYRKNILPFDTPLPGLFLSNLEQIYPWDRGIDQAVLYAKKVAQLVNNPSLDKVFDRGLDRKTTAEPANN